MPELPEVETVVRGLNASIGGDHIVSVKVLREDSVAFPDVALFCRSLGQKKFLQAWRRGKYIVIELEGGASLICHLRMSGRLIVKGMSGRKAVERGRFLRVLFKLSSGRELHFEDMRVFGRLWFKPDHLSLEEVVPSIAELGVEPLAQDNLGGGLSGELLQELFEGKSQAVKSALLDQRLVAGVGNIYADEALFLSGVHPQRKAGSLKKKEYENLAENVRAVLTMGIESGGSTLRDYVNAEGVNGNYQNQAYVYGRTGAPCLHCQSAIAKVKIAGRSSHFCPRCQKARP